MEKDIYFKQSKLFNPHENNIKCLVYGAGSIGSHVVIGLAKIGVRHIEVYDFDYIEPSNIPAQFYPKYAKGFKVDELRDIVKDMTGIEIKIHNLKIDDDFEPDREINSYHIIAFDNIEARKILFEKLLEFPVFLIDGRIGGFNYEKYFVNCMNDKEAEEYRKTLEGEFSELECGEKCLWVVNSLISSLIVSNIIRVSRGLDVPFYVKGNLLADRNIIKEGVENES